MRCGEVERDPARKLLREPHDEFVDKRILQVLVELRGGDTRRSGRRHDCGFKYAVAVRVVLVRYRRSDW